MKKKNIIFYILLILFMASLIFSAFKIPNYSALNVIIETKQAENDDFLIKYNENYYPFFLNKNAINKIINEKVDDIEILKNENFNKKINSIVVFNKYKTFYYNDFKSLNKNKNEKICFKDNACKIYEKYEIPNNIKLNSKSAFLNENTTFNYVSSLLYNFTRLNPLFLLSYILLSILIIYFINNKNEITLKFNNKLYLGLILFLIIILNLYENKTFLPWGDEIFALMCANPAFGLASIFNDPGVPPLYYLVLKIYILAFSSKILAIRLLSLGLILGGFGVLYKFILKNFNKTSANIALALLLLNIPLMYHAKQIRCYCLFIFLFILLFYFFFKILKKNSSKKDNAIYLILSILIINTHYFGVLVVIGNLIFSLYLSILKKQYKKIKSLILLNLVSLLSFLPFFIITAYSKALKDTTFNSFISTLSYENTINSLLFITNGALSLIIFSVCTYFYLKNKANKKQQLIVFYAIFIIFFTIFCALILSYLIRPMLTTRFMLIFIPLFIMLSSVYLSLVNKKSVLIFLIWLFACQNYMVKNEENYIKRRTSENNIYYISKQFEQNNKGKTYVLTRPSGNVYNQYFSDLLDENIDYIFVKQEKSIKNKDYVKKLINNELDKIKTKGAPVTVFTTILPVDDKINNLDNYTCFFNPTQDLCYWKIKLN